MRQLAITAILAGAAIIMLLLCAGHRLEHHHSNLPAPIASPEELLAGSTNSLLYARLWAVAASALMLSVSVWLWLGGTAKRLRRLAKAEHWRKVNDSAEIVFLTKDFKIRAASQSAKEQFAFSAGDDHSASFGQIFAPAVAKEIRDAHLRLRDLNATALAKEVELRGRNGDFLRANLIMHVCDSTQYVINTFSNLVPAVVPAQSSSFGKLEEYEKSLNVAGSFLWNAIDNLGYMRFSSQIRLVTGFRAESLDGLPDFIRHVHEPDLQKFTEFLEKLQILGEICECEFRFETAGGKLIWLLAKGAIEPLGKNGFHFYGMMHDVSTLRLRQAAIEYLAQMAACHRKNARHNKSAAD